MKYGSDHAQELVFLCIGAPGTGAVPPNNLLLHLRLWKEMEEGKIWATLEPRAGLKVEQ